MFLSGKVDYKMSYSFSSRPPQGIKNMPRAGKKSVQEFNFHTLELTRSLNLKGNS
jgi:hypothetical protein